jgi:hypothetical protein
MRARIPAAWATSVCQHPRGAVPAAVLVPIAEVTCEPASKFDQISPKVGVEPDQRALEVFL